MHVDMYAIKIIEAPEHSAYAKDHCVNLAGNGVALSFDRVKRWRTQAGAQRWIDTKLQGWQGFKFAVVVHNSPTLAVVVKEG